jgi:hypothetical protein
MSIERDRFRQYAGQPFAPPIADTGSIDTTMALRIANALEYIAAQLGEINRKLDTFNAVGPTDSAIAAAAKRLADQI